MSEALPPGLYILGFGGHARSVADVAMAMGIRQLVFVDHNARAGEAFAGHSVIKQLPMETEAGWLAFPALGDNARRRALYDGQALSFTSLVAPDASVGIESVIGVGVLVGRHAHIGPAARIGRGAIINTGAIVDHETQIGDFTHISINATVAGRCRIGANVMVGAGAVVIDGLSIADGVIIGAGATVVADIVQPGTYVGTPARPISRR